MISFICRKCGASVRMYPHTHRIVQCRVCTQWYEVDQNDTFTIILLDSFNGKSSVPDQIRAMKDKIVEYLDTKLHDIIIFGPNDIYIPTCGRKINMEKQKLQSYLLAWMDTWRKDANWRIDGYTIKRYNDTKPFRYIAVRG